MAKKDKDITEIAEKQRHLHLLGKVKGNKALSKSELSELKRLERKYKTKPPKPGKSQFTIKQQRFIDCYDGNIKKAAKKAGLSYNYCRSRLVAKSSIKEAIKNRQDTEVRPKLIATRQQRQEFWTKAMYDEEAELRDQLRASELLGKSEADFTENLSHKFPEGCGVMLIGSEGKPGDWPKKSKKFHDENCNGNGNANKS